jgi:uncharacterized protein (UPF0210 family)
MRIRAITMGQIIPFLNRNEAILSYLQENLENFNNFCNEISHQFEDINILIDTKRVCSQPLFSYDNKLFYEKNLKETLVDISEQLNFLQAIFKDYNIDYFACCMMLANKIQELGIFEKLLLNEVPQFIKNSETFFTSLPLASVETGINITALKSSAKIIKKLSENQVFLLL